MNELTTQQNAVVASVGDNMFFNVQMFEHAQRVAKMLGASTMVPSHFQGPQNIGNVMIAMNYAQRVRADVFMVMQSLYVVHGRPGLEGKLVIALVNQCGRFEPLEFEIDNDGCLAFAKEIKSEKVLKGPKVTWDMVKAEGWLGKTGSKWQTMPDVMFRYRSAAFFARTYCPEVLLGMQTKEELEDYITLKPAANGRSWEREEPPAPEFDYDAFREDLIHKKGFAAQDIDAFEAKLSAHYNKPIEEIRQQIGDNPDSFSASLTKWAYTNGIPQHPPVQSDEPPTPETEEPPPPIEPVTPEESYDFDEGPKYPIRDEFINLKGAGLSTWVYKNKERIKDFTPDVVDDLKIKWKKIYGDIAFPLDKQDEPPKVNGNGPYLHCPMHDAKRSVKVCDTCVKSDKCQTYQEWLFENAETPES